MTIDQYILSVVFSKLNILTEIAGEQIGFLISMDYICCDERKEYHKQIL